jgi:electron transport complex protein RnfC
MRERAEEIVRGIAPFSATCSNARRSADRHRGQQAGSRRGDAGRGPADWPMDYEVVAVPTRYPAGGAKQLIRVLTGKEVPASKRSTELGVQCFNVATVYTAYRALACMASR